MSVPTIDLATVSRDQRIPIDVVRQVWIAAFADFLYGNAADPAVRVCDGEHTYYVDERFLDTLENYLWFFSRLPLVLQPILLAQIVHDLREALDVEEETL